MKIVVYAIAKNEAAFARRWMDSMSEADEIVVLDTGSTDGTPDLLRSLGAEVTEETIIPWRFDAARNRSLEMVPEDADICVCTDLDEVFHPGWRARLEKAWKKGYSQAVYRYTWSFREDGSEGVVFWYEKIHTRHGFRWTHPVHEVLTWIGSGKPGPKVTVEGIQLDHLADPTKSRAQYLGLLELSVQEAPNDDRNVHYLGREYFFYRRWDDSIRTLKRHLTMPNATWKDERAASMRFIAKAYLHKGEKDQAESWFYRAIAEAPHLREPYLDLAMVLYEQKRWEGVVYFTGCALAIRERPRTYMTDADAWGSLPHDLRAIGLYETGRLSEALEAAKAAYAMEPSSKRLRENVLALQRLLS